MPKIYIENHNMTLDSNPGLSLLNNFLIHKAPIHTVCGGKARCGCCRIKIISREKGISRVTEEETAKLGKHSVANGWRLSCQTYSIRDATIYLPTPEELDEFCSER